LIGLPFGRSSWEHHDEPTDEDLTHPAAVSSHEEEPPADVFDEPVPEPDPDPDDASPAHVYEILARERGPVRFLATVTARMPQADELDDLQMDTGTPALEICRTMIDPDGRPVEVTVITAATDRFEAASAQNWPTDTAPVALRL
jgi:hypothetical protein